jgi:hypothetical protein
MSNVVLAKGSQDGACSRVDGSALLGVPGKAHFAEL